MARRPFLTEPVEMGYDPEDLGSATTLGVLPSTPVSSSLAQSVLQQQAAANGLAPIPQPSLSANAQRILQQRQAVAQPRRRTVPARSQRPLPMATDPDLTVPLELMQGGTPIPVVNDPNNSYLTDPASPINQIIATESEPVHPAYQDASAPLSRGQSNALALAVGGVAAWPNLISNLTRTAPLATNVLTPNRYTVTIPSAAPWFTRLANSGLGRAVLAASRLSLPATIAYLAATNPVDEVAASMGLDPTLYNSMLGEGDYGLDEEYLGY